ncbi:MAG: hypothetical protein IKU52_03730 [Clostridia bacterium]|nr:hypothetical protein [Clostridia bacterium]
MGLLDKIFDRDYGIVHKSAVIKYNGIEGWLIWDYLLVNELTFEEKESGKKHSLKVTVSDKKMEACFNELVEKYGI